MAQAQRQDNLFAAEDWKAVYQSFRNADFKAYDFDTLRDAMISYVRLNYPEDFNDWIQSSEFVALIDLVAFLGQNLAFRIDLNSRENFIDTAERKESVLRLARFLSYNPKRNLAGSGLLKIKSIKTTENVMDSQGNNLANAIVQWAGANDPESFEKFIAIMNAALPVNHLFGSPNKSGTVAGVTTQLYGLNSVPGNQVTVSFSATVGGAEDNFEICNSDFEDLAYFKESTPDPFAPWNIIYRNDGAGNTSTNTGFFCLFKQGQLNKTDLLITDYMENRVVDVDMSMVNENDVYVQKINDDGTLVETWEKVPNLVGNNIIYNNITQGQRKVYSVITRDNDMISIKFGDGLFSDVPRGIFRVWTRTSNSLSYTIRPEDMKNITWDIQYYDKSGRQQSLTITADLEVPVTNSSPAESLTSIRENAPAVYYSQDRMVTAQDYTVYPITQNSNVLKVKAINRVHSGFSRYQDIIDPTGTYQSVDIFTDDMYIYKENTYDTSFNKVNNTFFVRDLIAQNIEKQLTNAELLNLFYDNFPAVDFNMTDGNETQWKRVTLGYGVSTGYFTKGGLPIKIGTSTIGNQRQVQPGSILEIEYAPYDGSVASEWVGISSVFGNGLGLDDPLGNSLGIRADGAGVVSLNKTIRSGARIKRLIPAFKKKFTVAEHAAIKEQLDARNTFGIRYDYLTQAFKIVNKNDIGTNEFFSLTNSGNAEGLYKDNSWLIQASYQDGQYVISTKVSRYIAGSVAKVRFFNENFRKTLNAKQKKIEKDTIKILNVNRPPSGTTLFENDFVFKTDRYYKYTDGWTDNTKIIIGIADDNSDYLPDDPYAFREIVGNTTINLAPVTVNGITYATPSTTGTSYSGRANLKAQWHHVAESDQRIDPAQINIIDIFVLLTGYETEFRRWLANGGSADTRPQPPTSATLLGEFADLETVKTSSDTIVFRPAKYKLLFGPGADASLRAKFKVVKMPGTNRTDNEIRSKVLTALNSFFDIKNWTFGETFFFTELAAYIHTQLSGAISSIVLVPQGSYTTFGDLFQVGAAVDELFANCATVDDIEIITQITDINIKQIKA
jgi:hypothetical protein